MTASEPEPMVREENSRVPEPTVGSDLHSSQIYRIRRCEQFQRPPEHNYAAPCRRDRNGNIIFGRSTVDETTLNNDFVLDFPPILRGRRETGGGRNGRDQASYGPFFSEDRANNNDIQDDHHWARWMSDRNASLSAPRARRGSPAYSLSRYGFSFHNRNQGRNLGEDRYAVPRLNDSSESSNPSNVRQQSQARIRRIVCLRDSLR